MIVLGAAPEATERVGADDPQVAALVRELAGTAAADNAAAVARMDNAMQRDVQCKTSTQPSVLHRKIGTRDVYMVYGAAKDSSALSAPPVAWNCGIRGPARPVPFHTTCHPIDARVLTVRMPLESTEAQLIVFNRAAPDGDCRLRDAPAVEISGDWEFELKPTLDNRFGDYRLPAAPGFIGAEARRFRYSEQAAAASDPRLDDSAWRQTTYTYGQHLWKLGPLPNGVDTTELERRLAALNAVDPAVPVEFAGRQYRWTPYEFSMRWGVENDPGHQGYHGLKAEMPEEFIALGRLQLKATTSVYTEEEGGSRYYL
ncbi:MAG: hypothetical protein IPP47_33165 [Bryobacterales bacterium]|nr:hypothetical protein [Bryobacterales bacterium]